MRKIKRLFLFFKSLFRTKKVSVVLMGGLGNQLFQIAAVLHYAKKFNYQPVFTKKEQLHERIGDVGGMTYWSVFNTTNIVSLEQINELHYVSYREQKFNYTIFKKKYWDVMLKGYFQSPNYVNTVRSEMINWLFSNVVLTNQVNKRYLEIKNKFGTDNLVSMHIRRGDYLKLSKKYINLTLENYYKRALDNFDKKIPIIVFSNDIAWCKKEFKKSFDNPLYFIAEEECYELLLMSKIKNNIIANSTFSWWSAYINDNKDKTVIAPKSWFGEEWKGRNGERDWSGIYDSNWKCI